MFLRRSLREQAKLLLLLRTARLRSTTTHPPHLLNPMHRHSRINCSIPKLNFVAIGKRLQHTHAHTQARKHTHAHAHAHDDAHCWNCARVSQDRICSYSECGALQVPPSSDKVNYFLLLDLPVSFSVDLATANENYKRLQKSLHPDKFSLKTEREQNHSGLWSSLVNRAYKVVSDPKLRARYLVRLCEAEADPQKYHDLSVDADDEGVVVAQEDKNKVLGEVLMYVMEVRTQLEEGEMSVGTLQRLLEVNARHVQREVDKLEQAFHSMTEPDLDKAKQALMHLSYYSNLEQELQSALPVT